jgi:flagellar basal-body rod protein FlgC
MLLSDTLHIAASGLQAQGQRLQTVAENIANVDSTGRSPEEAPYRRKTISFKNVLDEQLGVEKVVVGRRGRDNGDFPLKYMPGHPAANEEGYVRIPNVNTMMEMMDMREARRGYEANLSVVESTRAMLQRTLDILR